MNLISQLASAEGSIEPELSIAESAYETPTLVPPPSDEPPPTARWTPPPALIESSRPGALDLSAPSWSPIGAEWSRR